MELKKEKKAKRKEKMKLAEHVKHVNALIELDQGGVDLKAV